LKRALISVTDKTGLVEFGKKLNEFGYEIVSTGNTFKKLDEAGVNVMQVESVTNFPEILDGTIILKKAVRIPGEKAKIAVDALDERIDPVGACVGVKGSRIHGVVRELRNENIDVIQWSKNPEVLVKRALGGVEINKVEINEEDHYALVYAPVEEISKIIGKQGQNIKLASWLTDYEIDVYREKQEDDDVELKEFDDEIEQWIIDEFTKVGLDTARSVLDKDTDVLLNLVDLEEETIEEVKRILREELE